MFSACQTPIHQQKDTVRNTEATGVFSWNRATYGLREAVNKTAEQVPHGVDELGTAGLEKEDSRVVRVAIGGEAVGGPMVRDSPNRFECEHYTTLRSAGNLPIGAVDVVVGKVVGSPIAERVLTTGGKVDVKKAEPVARCRYHEYAVVGDVFEMRVPEGSLNMLAGLEGSLKVDRKLKGGKGEAGEAGGME